MPFSLHLEKTNMRAWFLLLSVLCGLSSISQTSKNVLMKASPAEGGFSEARLKRIDQNLQSWVDAKQMNGCVGFIARNGKIVYQKAFGYDNMEKKTPMRTDHIFRIASQTKAITSVAVMMLYEEGKITLNDPVSKFIPEFRNPKVIDKFNFADTTWTTVPAKREITIKDLLTHTSGIGYAQIGSKEGNAMYAKFGINGGIATPFYDLAEVMKKLGQLPLFHQPGEKWTYGLNNDVLGRVIEVVSGMNFDQFLRTRLFEPLGMNDTYFYIPPAKRSRLVSLYTTDSTGIKLMSETVTVTETAQRDYPNMDGKFYSGGAGLSSTIFDYAIFLQMLLNSGTYNGKQILSRSTVRMMTSNNIGPAVWNGDEFGLGFGITSQFESGSTPLNPGSYEWGGMFATTYWVDPKEGIVGLFFRNIWPTSFDGGGRFKILTYQALAGQ
jgi:CubicO group peptidase (beta-lactamase class C family)